MPFFEPNDEVRMKPDYNKCTPVSVIVNFAPDGKMLPVYFGMTDLDESQHRIKLEGVKYTKELRGRTSYICVYNNGRRKQECMLTYYVQDHVWVLENI
jgi:hypothetical protein